MYFKHRGVYALQVYIRPAESYSTGQLEFHCMAVYPSQEEEQPVLKQSDTIVPVALDEAALINQEVCYVFGTYTLVCLVLRFHNLLNI